MCTWARVSAESGVEMGLRTWNPQADTYEDAGMNAKGTMLTLHSLIRTAVGVCPGRAWCRSVSSARSRDPFRNPIDDFQHEGVRLGSFQRCVVFHGPSFISGPRQTPVDCSYRSLCAGDAVSICGSSVVTFSQSTIRSRTGAS